MSRLFVLVLSLGVPFLVFAQNPFSYGVDSTVYYALVYPRTWNNLPEGFNFVALDSAIGKFEFNSCLVYNGKKIAYGNLKNNKPNGYWCIVHKDKPKMTIIGGYFKHGKKQRIWGEIDCWHIIYGRKYVKKITHSVFHC
ncbi:MAG: hypothetical protein H6598_07825 [Flavobacteriales bacterium]|nr:hypothetical protein [Flavobacteriales bacterium]